MLTAVIVAAAGVWWFSPFEYMAGLDGTPPKAVSGVPAEGLRFFRDVKDPVLAAGALVERHGRGVRAVDLGTGRTWWSLSRPGRASVTEVGKLDGTHVAVVWTDRRLTIVDVPSGHRLHVGLPDRSAHGSDLDEDKTPVQTNGLTDSHGHLLVVAVQDRGVDVYDASSGRRAWTRPAPRNCSYWDAVQDGIQVQNRVLSLDVYCSEDGTTQYAYSTLLGPTGTPLPGFGHFPGGSLLPAGDHELLQYEHHGVEGVGYRLIDLRTARTLWRVDQASSSPLGGLDEVTATAGRVVVTDPLGGQIAVYRAADGKALWRWRLPRFGEETILLHSGMVIAGRVRVLARHPGPVRVITFDASGEIMAEQELPMFETAGNPVLSGGAYETLVIRDSIPEPDSTARPSVLLTAAR
ncbi:PQQ-binding-like beta-propeller repeat protein [Spirillospora sp. NPDC047418]